MVIDRKNVSSAFAPDFSYFKSMTAATSTSKTADDIEANVGNVTAPYDSPINVENR